MSTTIDYINGCNVQELFFIDNAPLISDSCFYNALFINNINSYFGYLLEEDFFQHKSFYIYPKKQVFYISNSQLPDKLTINGEEITAKVFSIYVTLCALKSISVDFPEQWRKKYLALCLYAGQYRQYRLISDILLTAN